LSQETPHAPTTYDGDLVSQDELETAHCGEPEDRVPGRPEMTDFRRRLRYHQAKWREAEGHPIGTQPISPKPGGKVRPVGSRLPVDYAKETGANFVTPGAVEAATARSALKEPHQSFDRQRLWADLLWSTTLAFNLFGDLAGDVKLANRAVHSWWPDTPGTVSEVRFEHSPGWLDRAYLGNLSSFDAAFVLDLPDGTRGIVGVDTRYHERAKAEIPKPRNLRRYLEVAGAWGAFNAGATDAVKGRSDLCVMWLEHMLVHSMLQHPNRTWSWGRYVVVHPAGNSDYAELCARYADLLADRSRFSSMTVEELLHTDALPRKTAATLRKRYIPN